MARVISFDDKHTRLQSDHADTAVRIPISTRLIHKLVDDLAGEIECGPTTTTAQPPPSETPREKSVARIGNGLQRLDAEQLQVVEIIVACLVRGAM